MSPWLRESVGVYILWNSAKMTLRYTPPLCQPHYHFARKDIWHNEKENGAPVVVVAESFK